MAKAIEVAREFIRLSLSGEEPDPLTLSRVEKLLYYTQAWSLVIRESEVFEDDLEASPLGPVVPSIYSTLLGTDAQQISFLSDGTEESIFTGDLGDFLRSLWESYRNYSTIGLVEMTRGDPPCHPEPSNGTGRSLISMNDLEDYFATQAIPAPLAVYSHLRRRRTEEARERLATYPPLDFNLLKAAATGFSSGVRAKMR